MKKSQFKIDIFSIALLLFVAVLVSFYLTAGLYAKYTTGASTADSARVATFDASFNNPLETTFDVDVYPQSTAQTLIINSVNDSEVTVRFYVEIKQDGNLPLLISGVSPLTQDSSDTNLWYYDAAPAKGSTNLSLSIAWDPTQIGYQYSGGVAHITLKVYAEQID